MEGKEILQLEELESYIEWNICTQTLKEPIVTNWGHEFCKSWIEKWMRKKENCPIWRKEIIMIIRVPKLDLLVHGYEYLLGKEKQYTVF